MHLKVLTPTEILLDTEVTQVSAEGLSAGHFGLLPKHIDFTAPLVPSILVYKKPQDEKEYYIAIDEGALVKCKSEVRISVQNAIKGTDLEHLKDHVESQFRLEDEKEKETKMALMRLIADMAKTVETIKKQKAA